MEGGGEEKDQTGEDNGIGFQERLLFPSSSSSSSSSSLRLNQDEMDAAHVVSTLTTERKCLSISSVEREVLL